jgi:hypothetical protein
MLPLQDTVSPFQEEAWLKFSIISRDNGRLVASLLQARKCTRCEMINIHPETGVACPSQPLSLIKRHRDGPPHFGAAQRATSPAHVLILSSGIIAEVEADAAASDSIMVRAGDLISPCTLAPPPRRMCPAAQGSGAPVFGARSRFWSVESLVQGEAVADPPPGPALQSQSFYVFAAACGVAAACVIWAKYGK